ncbi:NAD-binding protein [Sulfurimonas sp.]|uniref:NAD-binding protein n=1 Tax=Sulfurimonas sp. TaxID=2022749 RepID=UPI00262FDD5F|nr:NAD-binding protein [Sulfurimonas sp.]
MTGKKNIVLFGYGNFARHLYKNLATSGHKIKVINTLEESATAFEDEDVDITLINIKKNEDVLSLGINPETDLLYCAMSKTANNLFLVLTLKALYPNADIIAISNSYENTRKLKYAGAGSVIDLYEATSRRVVNMFTRPAVTKALDEIIYNQNNIKMAEIELPQNSFLEGVSVSEIDFKAIGIILIAIIDKELGQELIFIDHRIDHKLDAGDTLVVVGLIDKLQDFKDKLELEE